MDKWKLILTICFSYIIGGHLILVALGEFESTKHITNVFRQGFNPFRLLYFITMGAALYLIALSFAKDKEPEGKIGKRTYIRAIIIFLGTFAFVAAVNSFK